MNAAFFGLAFLAALNPKLFAVDLLLMENARPRLMFVGGRHARRQLYHRAAPAGHRESSAAVQAAAFVAFVIIEFSLVIIPFVFLEIRPEATKARLQHIQEWLMSHVRQLMAAVAMAAVAMFVGAYMAISGLVRLLT